MRILIVLLWPAGIIAILVVTRLLARRWGRPSTPAIEPRYEPGDREAIVALRAARSSIIGMLLILAAGAIVIYAVACLLGVLAVHAGPAIDKPIYSWMNHHQAHSWKALMERLTKVGSARITWAAAAAAAVCLAALYRKDKWLPPVTLAAGIVIVHYLTLALRHTFHRLGPPDNPLGAYPSGGCDRIVVVYGLIAYLIWREVSGRKSTAIWSAGVVAALGFSEAYSRGYLTLHWFTDIISGLIYGGLVLGVFIATISLVAGQGSRVEGAAVPADPVPDLGLDIGLASVISESSCQPAETTAAHSPTLQ